MVDADEMYINAIEHWRLNRGIGTALIPAPLNDKFMVLGVLQRIYARSPTCKTIIITQNFNERSEISEFITQQENCDENNEEFKKLLKDGNIKILTLNFIRDRKLNLSPLLCIIYHPDTICSDLLNLLNRTKFKLVVLNRLMDNPEDMTTLHRLASILDDFKQNEIDELRLSTPVEEYQIGVDIPKDSDEFKLLEQYNEYISTSISIFGSFDVINQANIGNTQLNISSSQICYSISQENGWNEHLDMNIEFNREIDRLYNPNNLKERASKTYEIIRNRSQLLTDYQGKLDAILKIVQENPNKKILIINKRADFASVVTDYINNMSENNICMSYHDKLQNIPAVNVDGTPILFKSGNKKGTPKMLGAQAQRTLAVNNFNSDSINVLSTNNSPDKDLCIDVDIVIITSPFCGDISSYIYRLSKIVYRMNKITLYSIYCKNTVEQKQLEKKQLGKRHNVKNSIDDENNYDFIVDD